MLPTGKVLEVERLLAEGQLSQRKIARLLGISRGVIGQIARGERPDYSQRVRDEDALAPQGPIERCPGCGARVYVPCRLCHIRKLQSQEQDRLTKLRRQARTQAVKRILRAVLLAAEEEATESEAAHIVPPESTPTEAAASAPPRPLD